MTPEVLNEIVSENFIILIAIAVTEFIFLTYFAARFVSINPNTLKLTILESLRNKEILYRTPRIWNILSKY
jgi:uncharacterized Fe-S cluster-containing MiaB family protein